MFYSNKLLFLFSFQIKDTLGEIFKQIFLTFCISTLNVFELFRCFCKRAQSFLFLFFSFYITFILFSLAIIYTVFALANFIAPPICNLFGPRIAMFIGGICYRYELYSRATITCIF